MKTIEVKTLFIALLLSTAAPSLLAEMRQVDMDLFEAAQRGDVAGVKQALAAGVNINEKDEFGQPILMLVVTKGHLAVAKLLIKNGVNVNDRNKIDWTALMFAAMLGRLKIAELLIKNGADFNIKNKDGKTALEIAEKYKKTAVAKLIRAKRQEEVSKALLEEREELYPDLSGLISEFEN